MSHQHCVNKLPLTRFDSETKQCLHIPTCMKLFHLNPSKNSSRFTWKLLNIHTHERKREGLLVMLTGYINQTAYRRKCSLNRYSCTASSEAVLNYRHSGQSEFAGFRHQNLDQRHRVSFSSVLGWSVAVGGVVAAVAAAHAESSFGKGASDWRKLVADS